MQSGREKREILVESGTSSTTPISISMEGVETTLHVRIEKGASAIIFDTSSSALHQAHIELMEEAVLTYVSLSTSSVRRCTSTLHEGAKVHWHCTTLGTCKEPHTLSSTLQGRNAQSDIDWIFRVLGSEKQMLAVRNIFAAENGAGEITLKGVAEGTAYASCEGMIEITEAGQGTNTYLTEDVLMLDPTAKIDAVPGLEIRTNDVKASHSATVSRVTPEDLFYFQARGIDEVTARAMYTEGFLADLTERIGDEEVRKVVQGALMRE